MARPIKLIPKGERFGRLVAIRDIQKKYGEPAKTEFLCDCGSTCIKNNNDVRGGKVKSCGCYQKECASAVGSSNRIEIIGEKFHRWTVIARSDRTSSDDESYQATYFCRCECGTYANVFGQALRNGKSKSCGCYKKDFARSLKARYDQVSDVKMAMVHFNGDYKDLKGVGFKCSKNNGIKYYFEPKEYTSSIWIIKAGGGAIIDYSLSDFRLHSHLLDFVLENRELIETTDDFKGKSGSKLNSLKLTFNGVKFVEDKSPFYTGRQFYIKNLKMWLWLYDHGNLTVHRVGN